MLNENPIEHGRVQSAVFVLTTKRLIIAHVSTIPSARPSPSRLAELRANGWRLYEIAGMYDMDLKILTKMVAEAA